MRTEQRQQLITGEQTIKVVQPKLHEGFLTNQADAAIPHHSSILQQFDRSQGPQSAPSSCRLLRPLRAVLFSFLLHSILVRPRLWPWISDEKWKCGVSTRKAGWFGKSLPVSRGSLHRAQSFISAVSAVGALLECTPASDWERTQQSSGTRLSVAISLAVAEVPGQELLWRLLGRVSSHRCGWCFPPHFLPCYDIIRTDCRSSSTGGATAVGWPCRDIRLCSQCKVLVRVHVAALATGVVVRMIHEVVVSERERQITFLDSGGTQRVPCGSVVYR